MKEANVKNPKESIPPLNDHNAKSSLSVKQEEHDFIILEHERLEKELRAGQSVYESILNEARQKQKDNKEYKALYNEVKSSLDKLNQDIQEASKQKSEVKKYFEDQLKDKDNKELMPKIIFNYRTVLQLRNKLNDLNRKYESIIEKGRLVIKKFNIRIIKEELEQVRRELERFEVNIKLCKREEALYTNLIKKRKEEYKKLISEIRLAKTDLLESKKDNDQYKVKNKKHIEPNEELKSKTQHERNYSNPIDIKAVREAAKFNNTIGLIEQLNEHTIILKSECDKKKEELLEIEKKVKDIADFAQAQQIKLEEIKKGIVESIEQRNKLQAEIKEFKEEIKKQKTIKKISQGQQTMKQTNDSPYKEIKDCIQKFEKDLYKTKEQIKGILDKYMKHFIEQKVNIIHSYKSSNKPQFLCYLNNY